MLTRCYALMIHLSRASLTSFGTFAICIRFGNSLSRLDTDHQVGWTHLSGNSHTSVSQPWFIMQISELDLIVGQLKSFCKVCPKVYSLYSTHIISLAPQSHSLSSPPLTCTMAIALPLDMYWPSFLKEGLGLGGGIGPKKIRYTFWPPCPRPLLY